MNTSRALIILILLSAFSLPIPELYAYEVDSVSFAPFPPRDCDPLSLVVCGYFPAANYSIAGSSLNISGSQITLDLFAIVSGSGAQVITAYQHVEPIGMLSSGLYSVLVNCHFNGSIRDTHTDQLTVGTCCSVTASFFASAPSFVCKGELTQLTSNSIGSTQYTWKVNGHVFSHAQDTSWVFTDPGPHTFTLLASDSTCTDSTSRTITVPESPAIQLTPTHPTCSGDSNGMIDLDLAGGLPPFVISWTTGDTTRDISNLNAGDYIVTIRDSIGCVFRDTASLVTASSLSAYFRTESLGLFVRLTDSSDVTAISWSWDFGDGNSSSLQDPTHTYSAPGMYLICLTVTDALGCRDSTCTEVTATSAGAIDPSQDIPIAYYYHSDTETLHIQPDPTNQGPGIFEIFDLTGAKLLRFRCADLGRPVRLATALIPKGVFVIRISGTHSTKTTKWIKH